MGYLLWRCSINTKSFTNKITKMKKVFALIAIVGFVACNNAETKVAAVDSTKIKDSIAKATAPVVDTTKHDTTATAPAITTAPAEAPKK
jgi:hypothetical protein